MDEKTEELRDIFLDVADENTVTETQEESRGSLAGDGDDDADERIERVVGEMREAFEFTTDLSDPELVRVVQGFYEGETDSAIAEALGSSRSVVFRARTDLHLLRDRDTDAPFELADLRELLADGATTAEIADELGVSASTVRKYRRVVDARTEARQVSDRYRSEFEDAFVDAKLGESMTEDVTEDGLEEATEGMEAESDISM
jgi:DNA-binding NarL/FixJ family response regulator